MVGVIVRWVVDNTTVASYIFVKISGGDGEVNMLPKDVSLRTSSAYFYLYLL